MNNTMKTPVGSYTKIMVFKALITALIFFPFFYINVIGLYFFQTQAIISLLLEILFFALPVATMLLLERPLVRHYTAVDNVAISELRFKFLYNIGSVILAYIIANALLVIFAMIFLY